MDGTTYIYLGISIVLIAFAGLTVTQLILRRWKKNYDAEWDSK